MIKCIVSLKKKKAFEGVADKNNILHCLNGRPSSPSLWPTLSNLTLQLSLYILFSKSNNIHKRHHLGKCQKLSLADTQVCEWVHNGQSQKKKKSSEYLTNKHVAEILHQKQHFWVSLLHKCTGNLLVSQCCQELFTNNWSHV